MDQIPDLAVDQIFLLGFLPVLFNVQLDVDAGVPVQVGDQDGQEEGIGGDLPAEAVLVGGGGGQVFKDGIHNQLSVPGQDIVRGGQGTDLFNGIEPGFPPAKLGGQFRQGGVAEFQAVPDILEEHPGLLVHRGPGQVGHGVGDLFRGLTAGIAQGFSVGRGDDVDAFKGLGEIPDPGQGLGIEDGVLARAFHGKHDHDLGSAAGEGLAHGFAGHPGRVLRGQEPGGRVGREIGQIHPGQDGEEEQKDEYGSGEPDDKGLDALLDHVFISVAGS